MPQTVAQWWQPKYRAAWALLQANLAQAYDANPYLREVAVSSCAASTAEPMIIDYGTTLKAAEADPYDYTTDKEHECLVGAFADYAPWKATNLYFPLNGIAGDSSIAPDILQRCAASFPSGGPRCVLANNALAPGVDQSTTLGPIYSGIAAAYQAAPQSTWVAFQMNGPPPSTWCAAIAVAVAYHASSVELWPQHASVAVPTLTARSQALAAGTAPSCP
jgi:hypothetical protein